MNRSIIFLLAVSASLWAASDVSHSPADLIERGHFKRAEALLSTQLKQSPNDANANFLMSKVSVAYGRWDDAVQQAERAVSADGKRAGYHAQFADALVSKLSKSDAGMFARLSLSSRFRSEAQLALQLDPKHVDANTDLVEFYLEAPGIAGGGKGKAQDQAESVMKLDPPLGYFLKGEIANHEKQPTEAEQFYRKATEAAPSEYLYRAAFANFLLGQGKGKYSQAEEQARQAVKLDPDRITAFTTLAVIYTTLGNWKDLDTLLAESERRIPDDLGPHYQSAKAILTSRDNSQLSRAESYLRKYLAQPAEGNEPSLAGAHWRLGLVLEKLGRKDEARKEVQTAVNLDPTLKPARQDLKHLK